MKWTNDRSENVDDRRGTGGGGGMLVGGGLGTLIIAAIIFSLEATLQRFFHQELAVRPNKPSKEIYRQMN